MKDITPKELILLRHIVACWEVDDTNDRNTRDIIKETKLLKSLKNKLYINEY